MSEHQDSPDEGVAKTRITAPRPLGQMKTVLAGPSHTTTLPVVQWTSGGPTLEPRALPRYETLDRLGEGGMGEVVKAIDNDIGRTVAVKRLRADLTHPELSARVVEEVRTVGQLEHPNIVPIHDAGHDEQGFYFVMKHVEGESMEAVIARLAKGDRAAHQRWTPERRMEVFRKVLEALRYAHQKGVVHRDIKPANILLGPMGEVFVLDWGIARRAREPGAAAPGGATPATSALQTQLGAIIGTPHYMSPEQARGEVVDARSDLYSLCLAMWEFMTLAHPLAHLSNPAQVLTAVQTMKVPHASFTRSPHQRLVPMDIGWALHKGLAKDPAQRYQSADEALSRLDERAEGKVPVQCHVTFAKRSTFELMSFVQHHPTLSPALLLAALAGLWWLQR